MSLTLYKPNSKNSGCAFSFRIGVNKKYELTLYVSAIQQFSWDAGKRSGSFSGNRDNPDKNINIKFNEFEIRHQLNLLHGISRLKFKTRQSPFPLLERFLQETEIKPSGFLLNLVKYRRLQSSSDFISMNCINIGAEKK